MGDAMSSKNGQVVWCRLGLQVTKRSGCYV
jgi:hypothetical protein